jgi:hypothetical protein
MTDREQPASAPAAAPPIVPAKRPAYEPPARLLKPIARDPHMRRPASVTAGAALVLLRVIAGGVVLASIAAGWDALRSDTGAVLEGFEPTPEGWHAALWVVLSVGAAVLLIDLLLAVFVFLGQNWARVIVMCISVLSISTVFGAWWVQGQEITVEGSFVSLAIDILLLLALSSRSAAAYARRKERP